MATVQLTDIIDVTVFNDLPAVNSPERTRFFESGVAIRSGLLDQLATAEGRIAELPFWKDLDAATEANLSSDDPTSSATPVKVTQDEQISRKAFLNNGWSESDLASEVVMGPKAMEHIRSRVDSYWTKQWQRRLVGAVNGVLADNVANDLSDMVNDISGATNGDVTASTKFTRAAFTTAAFTSGDHFDDFTALAVHSAVYKTMIDNDDIDFIPDSEGRLTIPTFMGRRVIVDDGMPFTAAGGAAASDTAPEYTSVLFGPGAFGWGEGSPKIPTAIEREESQGDGGGIETLWSRKTWILHPFGFQQTGTPAGTSFTRAELAAATSWDRVVDRKNVPMAFLVTNG